MGSQSEDQRKGKMGDKTLKILFSKKISSKILCKMLKCDFLNTILEKIQSHILVWH